MDTDQFWRLIEQARAVAGPEANQAIRDFDDIDPDRDYWDPSALDADWLTERLADLGGGDEDVEEVDSHDDEEDEDELTDPIAMALFQLLIQLSAAEIGEFDNIFEDVRAAAAQPELAVAAQLIEHGFLAEDSFDDFRAGLVALGRETYDAAVANPDSLADHPLVREIAAANDPRWLGRDDMVFVASHAYAAVTGEPEITFFDYAESLRDESDDADEADSADQAWDLADEEQTRGRLPRLSQLFYERSMRNRQRVSNRLEELGLQD